MSDAPEMVWLIEPNKVNGTAFTYTTSVPPERVEYIRADLSTAKDARIADLTRQLAEARDNVLEEAAVAADEWSGETFDGDPITVGDAIRNLKGTP